MQINEIYLREYAETKLTRLHREALVEQKTRLNGQGQQNEPAPVVRSRWLKVLQKYFQGGVVGWATPPAR